MTLTTPAFGAQTELRDVIRANPGLPAIDNDGLNALDLDHVAVTAGPGGGLELSAKTKLTNVDADLLLSVRPGGAYSLGIKTGAASLEQLTGVRAPVSLNAAAVVLSNDDAPRAAAQLSPAELDFYDDIYGVGFRSLSLPRGLKLVAAADLGDGMDQVAGAIGIRTGGTVLLEGNTKLFGGHEVSLRAALGNFRFDQQPDWFEKGDVAVEIGPGGLRFTGTLGMKIRREGQGCVEGTPIGGACYDRLSFTIAAGVELGAQPSLTLAGILAGTQPWKHAFGQDWLEIRRAALQLGVTSSPTGPEVTMGFQGDVKVGSKDVAAAIKVGLSSLPTPPFVKVNLVGFSAASTSGVALSDLVWLNEQITGKHLDTAALPDLSLRNLSLQYSLQTDADLCLTQGVRFNADLYANGPAPRGTDADPNGCRTLDLNPRTRQSCLDRRAEGCLASVYGRFDTDGLLAGGEINGFQTGPVDFDDATVRLALTPAQQLLRIRGGARIGTLAEGRGDLDLSRTGLTYAGDASLFAGAARGYLVASAPFDLAQPSFNVEAWLHADTRAAITTAVQLPGRRRAPGRGPAHPPAGRPRAQRERDRRPRPAGAAHPGRRHRPRRAAYHHRRDRPDGGRDRHLRALGADPRHAAARPLVRRRRHQRPPLGRRPVHRPGDGARLLDRPADPRRRSGPVRAAAGAQLLVDRADRRDRSPGDGEHAAARRHRRLHRHASARSSTGSPAPRARSSTSTAPTSASTRPSWRRAA